MAPSSRQISPLVTWHSQAGLLWISWSWGLSYIVPPEDRVPFSEVFPRSMITGLVPMWGWGLVLLLSATLALVAERTLRSTRFRPWHMAWTGHAILAATYATLAITALAQSVAEVSGSPGTLHFWGNIISAVSRTVLWGYIGYLHSTYARLPHLPPELL